MTGRPEEEEWDVVVVGAGPAGSSAALGALAEDPSLRVLLLDRSDFPRDKSCGDGIAPQAIDVLAEVGAADVVAGWAPVRHLELARGDVRVSRTMRREAYVIPRAVLDARLVERAVERGAVLERHRATSLTTGPHGPVVSGDIAGRVVVGADGAHSLVRRALLGDRRQQRAIAIRGYAPTTDAVRGRQVIRYGARRHPSYAWAFDRGDGWANVGYGELLPPERERGSAPSRKLMLDQLEALIPGVAGSGGEWRGHHLPLSGWRWHQPDGPVLLVGDAAGLINPMTGEGIYYAVASGVAAGRAAARSLAAGDPDGAGARHRAEVRGLLGRHLRHTWTASRLAQSPRVVDAGIRAAAGDQHVFDSLVEIGLGGGRIDARLAGGLLHSLIRPARPTGAREPT
ncbi:geranylgeranyl reductase family protein [Nocardioides oleivorans]|nr:geranylgeranyl reductase family protein [Nocardioides oleivorans]